MALPDTPHAVIPLVIREILAANAGLAAFFERIEVRERRQLRGQILRQSLLIVPGQLTQLRATGGGMDCNFSVSVLAAFPPEILWTPALAALAAPSVTASGTGSMTGAYRYRVTQANEWGESAAGAEATVTADADVVTVTRPSLAASATCWRVWASDAGRTALRWAATLPAAATSWVDDGTRRDDLAPIPFLAEDKLDDAQSVLIQNESLTWEGVRYATEAMEAQIVGDDVIPVRNIRLRELLLKIPTLVDPVTKRILTERV